jgi:hypothetical protein
MSLPLTELPDSARMWIYGLDRPLGEEESDALRTNLLEFVDRWTAHGAQLRAAIDIIENRFAIVAVDETVAETSGCSIDAIVQHMEALEQELGCSFLDGMRVFYRTAKGEITGCDRSVFRREAESGTISNATPVFDLTISTLGELRSGGLERPLRESWHQELVHEALKSS